MASDKRVEAIRSNPLVGRGSCTSIDECWEDIELVKALDREHITTAKAAVEWAIEEESVWHERSLDCRWGEDSDPELVAWRQWEADVAAFRAR